MFKNRYPDIKAYDQTRVRLSERNGSIGSDYINANFVLGYKERKKFICAQVGVALNSVGQCENIFSKTICETGSNG